jgi:cell division septal protein FtsQ
MYTFEKCDEGFVASREDTGHAIARITAVEVTQPTAQDENGQTVFLKKETKPLPKDQWLFHFTGHKLNPSDLKALLEETAALP